VAKENIRNAHYIKLGAGGKYALSAMAEGRMRFGWDRIPLKEIHARDWTSIRQRLAKYHQNKATVTSDLERLRDLVTSTPADVWITFHDSHLWWGRLSAEAVGQDTISKYRTLSDGWRNTDVTGVPLTVNRIPGVIAQLQGFRGTVCSVGDTEALRRLINAEFSPAYKKLQASHQQVMQDVQAAIRGLHWKDFEVLVDLVFRQAGWRRRSMLGESMKYVDLELVEPITGEAYQVQIKSKASLAEFEAYAKRFSREGFRKLYFVVHSPSRDLEGLESEFEDVELVLPSRLGELVAEGGLIRWVLDKVR
jgi:hypothetical protein